MLTKTSVTGLRTLMYVALYGGGRPVSPRRAAEALGESATYMSKVARLLARADIVRNLRGAAGGMTLAHPAEKITLLSVVEACQGLILADYCEDFPDDVKTCSFHQAMKELHESTVRSLSNWTLADLLKKPCPCESLQETPDCRLGFQEILAKHPPSGMDGVVRMSG